MDNVDRDIIQKIRHRSKDSFTNMTDDKIYSINIKDFWYPLIKCIHRVRLWTERRLDDKP